MMSSRPGSLLGTKSDRSRGPAAMKARVVLRFASVAILSGILFPATSCRKSPVAPESDAQVAPQSSLLSFEADRLSVIGGSATHYCRLIYPDASLPDTLLPMGEFIVAVNQEFTVKMTGCSLHQSWQYFIEDTVVKLVRIDSSIDGSQKTFGYTYKASARCKGSIGFAENDTSSPYGGISNRSRGLFVTYNCGPSSPVVLTIDHQGWAVDTSTANFTLLLLYLSGRTNAVKLKVENYGDGVRSTITVVPGSDGTFSDTLAIAFSYGSRGAKTCPGTRIAIYGGPGFPEILGISNPLSVN